MKEAAHQLNYSDDAVLHLIKATMPAEIYGTLYNQHDLDQGRVNQNTLGPLSLSFLDYLMEFYAVKSILNNKAH